MTTFRSAKLALAFLTRLPLSTGSASDVELGHSVGWFPLAGWMLGLLVAGVGLLVRGHLPPALAAVVLVALLAWATGGLHLDGWADLFDGFGGGRGDRARMLEIMRDSRIGAHGASALVLLLAAKVAALTELLPQGDLRLIVAFPLVARWAVVPLVLFFPYARREGLGKSFNGQAGPVELLVATVVTAGVAWVGAGVVVPAVAAVASSLLLGALVQSRLGGLTGDVYGAAIELAEVVFLAAAVARR